MYVQFLKLMADRTGLDSTTLHYLAVWQAMASIHRPVDLKTMLNILKYMANCPLYILVNGFKALHQGSPFLGFAQVSSALIETARRGS